MLTDSAALTIEPDWKLLAERIQCGDAAAQKEFHGLVSEGIRFLLTRQLGRHDLEDDVREVLLGATQGILEGQLRDPSHLRSYIVAIVTRQVVVHIQRAESSCSSRAEPDFEAVVSDGRDMERGQIERQNEALALRVLNAMPKQDRDVLVLFYVKGRSGEDICNRLHLTDTQFHSIKSRARLLFAEFGEQRMGTLTRPAT